MSPAHVVVDGSNIATEGRSLPSLRQLDDAVRQFQDEFPDPVVIVVVDATFGHRIDPSERKAFDEAVAHGELVSPPAGAIGRGDAFVLRIAERVGGRVLSNDSFQEFHAEHPWLFEEGRLVGGKPVPGIGWIFTPRLPVRGPASRPAAISKRGTPAPSKATEEAPVGRRRGRSSAVLQAVEAAAAEAVESAGERDDAAPAKAAGGPGTGTGTGTAGSASRRRRRRRRPGDPEVQAAIEAATEEAVGTGDRQGTGRTGRGERHAAAGGPQAVNDPLTFLTFISDHPLGEEIEGVVSNFVSHGAMVDVGEMHCYVPLSGLGDPPPKSARAVLRKGEKRRFVIVALDPPRRGAQLALVPDGTMTGTAAASRLSKATKRATEGAKAAKAPPKAAAKPAKAPPKAAAKPAEAHPKAAAKPAKAPPKAAAKTAKTVAKRQPGRRQARPTA